MHIDNRNLNSLCYYYEKMELRDRNYYNWYIRPGGKNRFGLFYECCRCFGKLNGTEIRERADGKGDGVYV